MALIVIREEKIESAHNGASEKPWGFGTDLLCSSLVGTNQHIYYALQSDRRSIREGVEWSGVEE